MIHYTCDRCRRTLATTEVRYVLRLDVQGVCEDEPAIGDDVDSLSELHQLLEGIQCEDHDGPDVLPAFESKFDLCPHCYQQFARNPLGREMAIAMGFSNN